MPEYKTIFGQTIATTHKDSHGEEYDKDFLIGLCKSMPPKVVLHQKHDMSLPTVGFFTNPRVVQDGEEHWKLIADVYIEADKEQPDFKGFSWSVLDVVEQNVPAETEGIVALYVPWPYYNDPELKKWFLEQEQPVAFGRWIRKGLGLPAIALISAWTIFLLTPFWRNTVDQILWPRLKAQIDKLRELWSRDVETHLLCVFRYDDGQKFNAYFLPDKTTPEPSFSLEAIASGHQRIQEGARRLLEDSGRKLRLVKLGFDPERNAYRAFYLEFADGEVHVLPDRTFGES